MCIWNNKFQSNAIEKILNINVNLIPKTITASSLWSRLDSNCCATETFAGAILVGFWNKAWASILFYLQVISSNSVDRQQPESLIIGKRKPSLEFQFQNKFRLGGEMIGRPRNNVIMRGSGVGGDNRMARALSGTNPGHRYKPRQYATSYCDPCTDYLNNPMFHSLHSR